MKRRYRHLQLLAGAYLVIYLAALYAATGVGVGFKLDDHQLVGYLSCTLLLGSLMGSLLATTLTVKRWWASLLVIDCFILLGITSFNVVSFNEGFWYFIPWVYLIPIVDFVETVIFMKTENNDSCN